MFRESRSSGRLKVGGARNFWIRALGGHRNLTCEEWLEREDVVVYSRNFSDDPILVYHQKQEMKRPCAVGCKMGPHPSKKPDAIISQHPKAEAPTVLLSMESSAYYPDINIAQARRVGYEYVMTTSLSSDVPVGYFSWAEYDIMAPVLPKTKKALAAAFISNCEARNFRIKALVRLENENIKIDSYGRCHRNRNENVDKVKALKHYKFSLAFENSNEEDYVTEKFFQSLVAGSVPVVVGAPNIEDFAPSPGSYLHIKELEDVGSVAERMKYLSENQDAYNESLRWKYEGPSDSFKALLDMAAVHSSCRLCIHLATIFRQDEEKNPDVQKRPCKCEMGSETLYHLYVRERGRFEMDSIFLRSGNMTLEALEASVLMHFKTRKHEPIWKWERPESIRGGGVVLFTRSQTPHKRQGIRVNVVCPEFVGTAMGEKAEPNFVSLTGGFTPMETVALKVFPKGLDIVYECVGGNMFDLCINALAIRGRLIVIGMISQYQEKHGWMPLNYPGLVEKLLAKSQTVVGSVLFQYSSFWKQHLIRLFHLYSSGKLKVWIGSRMLSSICIRAKVLARLWFALIRALDIKWQSYDSKPTT
ncbi:Glycoprotein 3-alpha-L-fucosyltransferase A [Hibiscus syriacus]|uniref:Fucosyltransferase n=1 Tax=Hibiscus syriacus TaxID=106335 RepID=A0A6A3AT63_HIBSY|nr:Glycoprotein 3-alpha-L-fucosyltransferase A [Hibiscus syriacus]